MTKSKKVLITTVAIIGLTVAGTGIFYSVSAAEGTHPFDGLAKAIADKFNLNASDVQQVVDEQMAKIDTERQAKEQQEFTDRINKAVSEGKLTQEQADKIFAKKAELEAQKTDPSGKTKEEMASAMKTQMDSLKQWMTDNNIPQEYCPLGGHGGHGPDGLGPGGKVPGEPMGSPVPEATTASN
jgi:hypothetical protein